MLIVELGRYILDTACAAARDWPFGLAVNLSPAQFWDRTLVEDVSETLARHTFPPERLEFEITETYLLRRPEMADEIISRLREFGIRIALDDFGTGYPSWSLPSSLMYVIATDWRSGIHQAVCGHGETDEHSTRSPFEFPWLDEIHERGASKLFPRQNYLLDCACQYRHR